MYVTRMVRGINKKDLKMKICTTCNKEKEETQFYWRNKTKGIKHIHCKSCQEDVRRTKGYTKKYLPKIRQRSLKYRQQLEDFLIEYFSNHPCVKCGESDVIVLEFHHREPSQKEYNISQMKQFGFGIKKVQTEIEKCDVLCANCHKRITAQHQNSYRFKR